MPLLPQSEVLFLFLWFLLCLWFVIVAILMGYWIYADATARGSDSAFSWAAGGVLTMFIVAGYLFYRRKIGGRTDLASRRERIAGTVVFAQMFALALGAELSPPDPFTQLIQLPLFVGAGLLSGYWLVWRGGYARLRRRVGLVHDDEQRR